MSIIELSKQRAADRSAAQEFAALKDRARIDGLAAALRDEVVPQALAQRDVEWTQALAPQSNTLEQQLGAALAAYRPQTQAPQSAFI